MTRVWLLSMQCVVMYVQFADVQILVLVHRKCVCFRSCRNFRQTPSSLNTSTL